MYIRSHSASGVFVTYTNSIYVYLCLCIQEPNTNTSIIHNLCNTCVILCMIFICLINTYSDDIKVNKSIVILYELYMISLIK